MPNIDMNLSVHRLFPGTLFQSKYQYISTWKKKKKKDESQTRQTAIISSVG